MSPDRIFCLVLLLLGLIVEPAVSNSQRPVQNSGRPLQLRWDLEDLANSLKKHQHRKVRFRETHVSDLLTEPLKLSGTLTFTAPSHLEKHVTSPYEERYVVDGNKASYENLETGVSRTLSLDDYPALRGFVDGLRAAFTGNLEMLKKFFRLSLDGDRNEWQLTLNPIDEVTRNAIDSIKITGENDDVKNIAIQESSGDYSSIEITPDPG